MRRTWLIGSLLFLPLAAKGQEFPKAEMFGGYSYFRADGGGSLHGWNASVAASLNHWFGLVADFSGHYGSESVRIEGPNMVFINAKADSNMHVFLVGPTLSYRKHEKLTGFARVLFGAARAHADGRVNTPNFSVTFSNTDTAFAAALGGGLDVKLGKGLALRLIQAEYLLTRFGDDTQNNARISVGLVFRFGAK